MFYSLFRFEWMYHSRKPLLYIAGFCFLVIGMIAGSSSGITFPNVHANSPYQVTYLTGIFSLAAIFPVTFLIAQHFLREQDSGFDKILFATPVKKFPYLTCRIAGVVLISVLLFIPVVAGIFMGQILFPFPGDKTGPFRLINYVWPFLVLALPNILFCIAVLCSMAWLTKNKLIIYISGLCIYIFYIIGSIFANSPLIAGATVSSPEQMSLFAKLDPLGMAAFFEQTRYWTALERNTEPLSLTGNFLINRAGTILLSILLVAFGYFRYKFLLQGNAVKKVAVITLSTNSTAKEYYSLSPSVNSHLHFKQTILSFLRTDSKMILKGIPLLMIAMLWTALLSIELTNALSGPAGMGTIRATTGQMVTTIMDTFPFFSLLVILFYSNELVWRSKTVKIDQIEDATPYDALAKAIGKYASVAIVPLLMLGLSCLLAIIVQLINGVSFIRWELYGGLFYYLGLPALLSVMLIISIQQFLKNKYGGLLAASIVTFLTQSAIGQMIGITHPLLRYADVIDIPYSDMNGFGMYSTAFNYSMTYWSSFALIIVMIANRSSFARRVKMKLVFIIFTIIFLVTGIFIFYHTNLVVPRLTQSSINRHKQLYEEKFKKYAHMPQPAITAVEASVDLFPDNAWYKVKGTYVLNNNNAFDIDSLLLFIPDEITIDKIHIQQAVPAGDASAFGHYWYTLKKPLAPGDSLLMEFSFTSSWSLFTAHVAFNAIVSNGTFLRISNFFPTFGYEPGKELTNSMERRKRKMPPQDELKKLEAPEADSTDYRFINLDMTISTSGNQTAIGMGKLARKWTQDGRNYFRYVSDRTIPFRFALSSAAYVVKKDQHNGIPIEIFYHPGHGQNVDELIADAKQTISYCERNFGPYPHPVIRFAEISSFSEGFAATAYPGVIFMKENGGYTNNLAVDNTHDIINQLAGHELSHQWWGSASLVPDHREGGWVLTETLAKYTELMLYQQEHGAESTSDIIRYHTDMYFSNRSFSHETPLFKTTFDTPHLPYNKGTVVMYQLRRLMGEEGMNAALKAFFHQHRYPNRPPTTEDLLREIYKAAPAKLHARIDELFKDVIVYDNEINTVTGRQLADGKYELSFTAFIRKYREDGSGNRITLPASGSVQFAIEQVDGSTELKTFAINNNKVTATIIQQKKPVQIIMDPFFDYLDRSADNRKQVVLNNF